MVHRVVLGLAGLALLALVVAVAHQLVVDSPLFELGAEHWFPGAPDGVALATALRRLVAAGVLPAAGTAVAAWFVVTAPFRTWLWAVVAVVALTGVVSPLLQVAQLASRPPTAAEAARLAQAPTDGDRVALRVVDGARGGPVNGFAVGGPFADSVGVSRYALERLDERQLAALVGHELGHHRLHHALVRAGVSVAWLAAGAAVLTALFATLTTVALAGMVALVVGERLVAGLATRRTEYHADEFAARRTSPAAMVDLLATLDADLAVDQRAVPWYQRLFSTHPPYERRIARLRRVFGDDDPGSGSTEQNPS